MCRKGAGNTYDCDSVQKGIGTSCAQSVGICNICRVDGFCGNSVSSQTGSYGTPRSSLQSSATCSTGCQCVNRRLLLPPSTVPWHWPSILQARLHAGFRHLWSGTLFCWTPRHAGSSHQNWARPTEFSSCCTDRLELSSGTSALNTD